MSLNPANYEMPTLDELIDRANRDTDDASIFTLGDELETADGAIVIVKGRAAMMRLLRLCEADGLSTPGKPVTEIPG